MPDESGKRSRALVVPAAGENRKTAEAVLASAGFSVTCADTARDALKFLEAKHVSLVFVDTVGGEWKQVIDTVSSDFSETAVLVCVRSGSANPDDLVKSGVDSVLGHPLSGEQLALSVPFALEHRKMVGKRNARLETLSHKLSMRSREYKNTRQELDQNTIDMIKTFVGLLETRYRYLGAHCKRVATFSRGICDRMDLNERIRNEIEIGALLHDIGKIAMPDILIQKTRDYFAYAQLTKKEQKIINKHPLIGQEAVEMIEMLKHVGAYIRHHHERYDGKGYPEGLKGRFIPLGARIICVTDAYDRIVMGADKVLRKNAGELFMKFLDKQTGVVFDPEAVRYMVEYIKDLESREYSRERRIPVEELEPGLVLSRDIYTSSGVLLISQYERLTPKDIARIRLFHKSSMIMGVVYVYGAEKVVEAKAPSKPSTKTEKEKMVGQLTFERVCAQIDELKELKTLSTVQTAVIEIMDDPKSTKDDVTGIIKQDQAIVAKLLRVVNSPLFGFSKEIASADEAVPLLGLNEVRGIVSSLSTVASPKDTSDNAFNPRQFWKHSLGCAVVSSIIGERLDAGNVDVFYSAGLLHDIGRLILSQLFPENLDRVLRKAASGEMYLRQAERLEFGKPHQVIGEYFLGRWHLPNVLRDVIRNHHSPADSTVDPIIVSAVHVADIITHMLDIGKSGECSVPKLDGFAERKLGITLSDFELLIPKIDEQIHASEALLSLYESE